MHRARSRYFQVEIQFDIHRVEPMVEESKTVKCTKISRFSNFEHYRQTLEEDSSLEKVNDTLLLGPDDEEWGWFRNTSAQYAPLLVSTILKISSQTKYIWKA